MRNAVTLAEAAIAIMRESIANPDDIVLREMAIDSASDLLGNALDYLSKIPGLPEADPISAEMRYLESRGGKP